MTTANVPRGSQHATTSFRALAISVRVDPRRLLRLMAVAIALLVIASTVAVGALAFFRWPEGSLGHETVKMFWLDTEHNLPTLYQCLTLAFAAALMFHIAKQPAVGVAADRLRWRVLAGAFVFLALDEFLRIHETVGDTSSFHFGAVGLLIYAPVVVIGLWWLPLLLRLEARARILFLLSAVLYVGGAAGVESLSQLYAGIAGKATPLYVMLATFEEVLEMAGIALLIYALLEHLLGLEAGHPTRDRRTEPMNEAS
jgi:hypothetical protein